MTQQPPRTPNPPEGADNPPEGADNPPEGADRDHPTYDPDQRSYADHAAEEPAGETLYEPKPLVGMFVANPGALTGATPVALPITTERAEEAYEPPAEPVAQPSDLIDLLVADHRTVADLFAAMESAQEPSRRRDLVDVAIAELTRHAAVEEQYLYPTARGCLADGAELADHDLAEHREAEQVMDQLMTTDPAHPDFDLLTERLVRDVRHHVAEEETNLFPRLRAECAADTLVNLGTEALAAKRLAPTRPHPGVPHQPPLNRVAGPLMGLVDHAVDALTDRPTTVDEL